MTDHGAKVVEELGPRVVGKDSGYEDIIRSRLTHHIELIDPSKISQVFLSPRQRATKTYELLFGAKVKDIAGEAELTEDARECELALVTNKIISNIDSGTYGDYEGLKVGDTLNSVSQLTQHSPSQPKLRPSIRISGSGQRAALMVRVQRRSQRVQTTWSGEYERSSRNTSKTEPKGLR